MTTIYLMTSIFKKIPLHYYEYRGITSRWNKVKMAYDINSSFSFHNVTQWNKLIGLKLKIITKLQKNSSRMYGRSIYMFDNHL